MLYHTVKTLYKRMKAQAQQEIQAILAQFQNYPGLEGVAKLEKMTRAICGRYGVSMPEAYIEFMTGLTYDRAHNLNNAVQHYTRCIELCKDDYPTLKLHAMVLKGSVYSDQEEYSLAYQLFKQVLDSIYLMDDSYLSLAYTNISDLFLSLEQYQAAYELASLGEKAGRQVGNRPNQAICLLNMGYALGHLNRFEQALKHITHAKDLAQDLGIQRSVAIAHGYMARVMSLAGSFPVEAIIEQFEIANSIYIKVDDKHNRAESLAYYAQLLEALNFDERAQSLCEELELLIDLKGNFSFYAILTQTKMKLAKKRGESEQLIALQESYIENVNSELASSKRREQKAIVEKVQSAATEQETQKLAKIRKNIGVITQIGQSIATSENIHSLLPTLYEKIGGIIPNEEFGIALYDESTNIIDYQYFYDLDGHVEPMSIDCSRQHSVGSYVINTRSTVHLNHVNDEALNPFVPKQYREQQDDARYNEENKPAQSIILTPITLGNKVLGLLSVQHSQPEQYHQHHCNLFEQLANFIAIALENRTQRHKLQRVNAKLERLSKTDPLTSLFNRYQLDSVAPALISTAENNDQPLAAVMIDVDYYKGYNDFHGHQQGDIALKLIAKQMKNIFHSDNDHLFRYGGDEFLILCYGQNHEEIESKILALQDSVKKLALGNPLSKCSDKLTLSIGGIYCPHLCPKSNNFNSLFNLADAELYKVKNKGRNGYLIRTCHKRHQQAFNSTV